MIGQIFEAFHWLHKRSLFALMRLMVLEAAPLKITSVLSLQLGRPKSKTAPGLHFISDSGFPTLVSHIDIYEIVVQNDRIPSKHL